MKRPILYITISLCVGILSAEFLNVPFPYLCALSAIFLTLALISAKNKISSHLNLYLAITLFGILLYQNSNTLPVDHIFNFTPEYEKKVLLKGVIVDDPIISATFYHTKKISFILKADAIKENSGWSDVTGLVKADIYDPKGKLFDFGDEVILEGLLSKPDSLKNPGLFDYSKYLAIKNIYSVLKVKRNFSAENIGGGQTNANAVIKMSYKLRHRIRDFIDEYFDAPHNGFLKAILVGDRSTLGNILNEDFIKTGTVHILSISGLHVGLIAALLLAIFGILNIPKKANLVLTTAVLIFYSFVAGSSPPIIRAVIMFSVFALGYLINRESDILNSLALAAFLILLWNPKELFDPSFQLSFLSIFSIVAFAPKIDGIFGLERIKRDSFFKKAKLYIFKGLSVSIAASLGVAPFVSLYFNIVSPVAILANLVVIPLSFLIIVIAFLFLIANLVMGSLAGSLSIALCATDNALFFINHLLSRLPFSYFRTPAPSMEFLILYYAALFSVFMLPKDQGFGNIKIRKRQILAFLLLLFCVSVWKGDLDPERKFLRIHFLDVGDGDSIFIEFPDRGNLLIDGGGGGDEESFDIGRSVIAPYLWNRGVYRIDALLVTHFHKDHLGGIPYILKNFDVGCAIDNGAIPDQDNKIYDEYRRAIKERNMKHLTLGEGDRIEGFGDAKIFILNPVKERNIFDSNENSIAAKLVYKNSSALFCGDIVDKTLDRLAETYGDFLKSDVIKVPHHGGILGDETTVKKFFVKVSPEVFVISCGRSAKLEKAAKSTSNIITHFNSTCYRTKSDGAIRLLMDGRSFKIKENKGKN